MLPRYRIDGNYMRICFLWLTAVLALASTALGYDTVGCQLHVENFNHPGLRELTWTEQIREYDFVPSGTNPYRYRIDFAFVGFAGKGVGNNDPYPYMSVTTQLTNAFAVFTDDAVIASFSAPGSPGIGLRISSLLFNLPDSSHGVALNANPAAFPNWGRVFENTDGLGSIAKTIDTRQSLGIVSPSSPITVKWTVRKIETVTNPSGNYAKNASGAWVPLVGTFVRWKFLAEINGLVADVADYYLPIEKAEYHCCPVVKGLRTSKCLIGNE